jgi:dihydroorotate dehydrogenase
MKIISGNIKNPEKPIELLGLDFPHPIGLAAGLDKNGVAIRPMRKLGFSFLELGTVTPLPQKGNDKPRLFRLKKDQALINRMGFNNDGVDALVAQLEKTRKDIIIGGNIGKNTLTPNKTAVEDYAVCFEKLLGHVDYFVVNVSCPNITDLRELQDKDSLSEILLRLLKIRKDKNFLTPILLKVSPDLNKDQLLDLIDVVKETAIDGLVATNTSVARDNLLTDSDQVERIGSGGLSGKPLSAKSTEVIKTLREELPKPFPIIASGGIMTPEDAIEKIEAGADLIQIYTGFIYEGPGIIRKILQKL